MPKSRRDLDLTKKSLATQRRREFGSNHFDGDRPRMLEILGEIDPRHSPTAELTLDSISAAKNIGQHGPQLFADQLIEDFDGVALEHQHLSFTVGDETLQLGSTMRVAAR